MAQNGQPRRPTVTAHDYDTESEYSAEIISSDLEPPKKTICSSAAVSLDLSLSSSSSSSSSDRTALAMAKPNSNHIRHGRFHNKDFKEGVGKSKLYKHYLRAMGISEQSRRRKRSATFNDTFVEPSPYSEMIYESLDFGCNFCGRRFHNAQALGGHQNAHKQERSSQRIARRSHTVNNWIGTNTSVISQSGPTYSLVEKNCHHVDIPSSATNLRQSHVRNWTANPKYPFHFNGRKDETTLKFKGFMTSGETACFHWPGISCTQNLQAHTNLSVQETRGNPGILLKTVENSENISVLDLSLRL